MKAIKSNRFSLALATSGLLFSGALYSQTVEINPAGPIPGTHTLVKTWEFNDDGDPEGWTGSGYGPLTVAGGVISGSTTNGDPQFASTFPAIPLGFSTIIEYALTIDPLELAASGGTFFWADFGGGIASSRSRSVTIQEDNTQHVVRVTFPGGVKNLTQLRLDPTSTAGKTVSFDYVRVYHYQPESFTSVTLTASDLAGTTSMDSAGNWDSLAPPTTGSNYFTGAFQLRTQSGTPYLPFGGSALSIDPDGSLLFKGSGGTLVRQMTLAGGSLLQGATGTTPDTARLFVPDGISVTAASTLGTVAVNRTIEITGSLSGIAALGVTGGGAPANAGPGNVPPAQSPGMVLLRSDNSGYTGTLSVGANSWLDLDHDNAVAGANVAVSSGGMVRRIAADANGTTTAASWAITGSGPSSGAESNRGAIYFSHNGLTANLVGPISISGAQSRIGTFSTGSALTLDGSISGLGTLGLWGGGGAENHVQTFILNGAATHEGQTDLLSEFGSQTHLRLGGNDRLPTGRKLRLNATWGATDNAGAFLDLNGFDQTLSSLQLDGSKRKFIRDVSASGNSVLTLTDNSNAFDANGGNIFINDITITHTGTNVDSGAFIDGTSVVTLTNATWNAPFFTTLGNAGSGSIVLNNSTFSFGGQILMARSNNNGTLTINADSLVTTPNAIRIGDSAAGVATVNLNGGTLEARSLYNFGVGAGILNLNGGILRATDNNLLDWIEGGANGVTVNLLVGGITLDSNNFNVLAGAAILEDPASTGGGITKIGDGSVTLAGASTYTGPTSVQVGNLIINGDHSAATGASSVVAGAGLGGDGTINAATYADGAELPWNVADWTAAPNLSAGAVTIDGALTVVVDDAVSVANFTDATTSFTILSASALNVVNPAALTVDATDFTLGTGTWSVQPNGNTLELVYTVAAAGGYAGWAAIHAGGQTADLDFDNDGVSNGVEYFMGETGSTFTPNPNVVAGTITWPKDPGFLGTFKVQISDTLANGGWTDIVPPNASINETNPDQIIFTLPTGDPRKFVRLSVTPAP
jgi:autotransporter-associated beta strand protein